jgi:hypothetical protein
MIAACRKSIAFPHIKGQSPQNLSYKRQASSNPISDRKHGFSVNRGAEPPRLGPKIAAAIRFVEIGPKSNYLFYHAS